MLNNLKGRGLYSSDFCSLIWAFFSLRFCYTFPLFGCNTLELGLTKPLSWSPWAHSFCDIRIIFSQWNFSKTDEYQMTFFQLALAFAWNIPYPWATVPQSCTWSSHQSQQDSGMQGSRVKLLAEYYSSLMQLSWFHFNPLFSGVFSLGKIIYWKLKCGLLVLHWEVCFCLIIFLWDCIYGNGKKNVIKASFVALF